MSGLSTGHHQEQQEKEPVLVRAFVFLGGLLVLALLGALFAPYFIDWTAYRTDFERQASQILGRKVVVEGEAEARLLPFPSVTFGDVTVLGDDGKALLTIARFRMDAELAPYLSGEIRIYSMTVDTPDIRVPVLADGTIDWVVERPAIPRGATVVLENVAVENGTVTVENGLTGRTHRLEDLNATLSAGSLAGPVDGRGSIVVGGEVIAFSVGIGTLQEGGDLPVRIETANETLATSLTLDGNASLKDGRPGFSGSIAVTRPLPPASATAEELAARDPFAPAAPDAAGEAASERAAVMPVKAVGAIVLSPTAAEVSDIRVQAGEATRPYLLTGEGRFDFAGIPKFLLNLEGEQIDVDRIAAEENGDADQVLGLAERVEAMRAVLAEIPRPTIPGTVEISLPVIMAGDTMIRDATLAASPTETGWSLSRLIAQLPGRTRLEATGLVDLDESFGFTGDLLLASNQPSGFADWLTGEIDPAIRRLGRAGLSAKAELSAERQAFTEMEIDVGGDRITGSLERARAADHTRITADLDGKAVDLDAFMALSQLFTGNADSLANADRFDVALTAGPVNLRDASADRIDADVSFDGDTLAIATFAVEGLSGATINASGELSDLAGEAQGRLAVSLQSDAPKRFFDFLLKRFPDVPLLRTLDSQAAHLAPLALSGEVETLEGEAGKKPTLFVRLDGTAAGSKIDLSSSIENGLYARTESGRFGLDLRLENDAPTVLLSQLGIPAIDIGAPAPLEAELSLSAAETGPVVTTATLRAPGSEVSLDGLLEVTPEGISGAEISAYLRSEDAAPWLLTGAIDLGQSLDAVPLQLNGALVYDGGHWSLNDLSGEVAGTRIAASLDKAVGEEVTGHVDLDRLSLPWIAHLVFGRPMTEGLGGDEWPTEAFRDSLMPSLPFSLRMTADNVLAGDHNFTDFSATMSGGAGEAAFSDASLTLPGGTLAGTFALRNADGLGRVTLDVATEGFALDSVWPALAAFEADPRMDATIRLEGTGQSYAALVSGLTGAGRVEARDLVLPGVPQAFLSPLLAVADQEGFSPDTDTQAALAMVSGGAGFAIAEAASDFAVTAGRVRFSPVTARDDGATLTMNGSVDLGEATVDGELRLEAAPGDDWVEGADPSVSYDVAGSLAAPRLTANVTPLANYLSVRALEREQARVEAMQENLQETLRLRRETRFYRWREAEAARIAAERRAAEEEAEQARRDAEAAAKAAAEAEAAQAAAAAEAEAAEARRREAAAAEEQRRQDAQRQQQAAEEQRGRAAAQARQRRAAPQAAPEAPAEPDSTLPPGVNFSRPIPEAPPGDSSRFPSLPGVANPLEF